MIDYRSLNMVEQEHADRLAAVRKNYEVELSNKVSEIEKFYETEIARLHSHYHYIISKEDQRIFDLEELLDEWLAKALHVRDKTFLALAVKTEEILK
jgi:hypothetical protein